MPLTSPWYAATSVGPTATGSRGRILGAMSRLRGVFCRKAKT